MPNYITSEDLENLKKELEYLKTTKTKEIAELIQHAASFGDLKENFAYHDAKDKQAFLQGKIVELTERVRNAQIIKKKESDKVQIGSNILMNIDGEEEKITIVGSGQADPLKGKISYESPLGKALLDKKAGERIEVNIEGNKLDCKILKID